MTAKVKTEKSNRFYVLTWLIFAGLVTYIKNFLTVEILAMYM